MRNSTSKRLSMKRGTRLKVVDASAVVELLLRTPKGIRVESRIVGEPLVAPELLHVEVVSAIARFVRADAVSVEDADKAIATFARTRITLMPQLELVAGAWQLRDRVRVTDAFYVVCAKRHGAALVTCDGRLTRAPLPGITIDLVH